MHSFFESLFKGCHLKKNAQIVSHFPQVLMNYMSSRHYISPTALVIFKRPPSSKQQHLKIFDSVAFVMGQLEK